MRQRIRNYITIYCPDVDLETSTNIEVYIRQGDTFLEYTPTVVDHETMTVDIPLADAMKLVLGQVSVQFALTDADGYPVAPDPKTISCGELLKEAGYDPV